jgi:hypothetical protein
LKLTFLSMACLDAYRVLIHPQPALPDGHRW